MNGEHYLGNTNSKEVHDLDNEDTSGSGCQIDEILNADHATPFSALGVATRAGCDKCLGSSRR